MKFRFVVFTVEMKRTTLTESREANRARLEFNTGFERTAHRDTPEPTVCVKIHSLSTRSQCNENCAADRAGSHFPVRR
jgi:hypothetical protein